MMAATSAWPLLQAALNGDREHPAAPRTPADMAALHAGLWPPHCMAARRASLHHRDLPAHPGAGMLDRLTRSRVLRLSRLENVKDVLRALRRPKSEEMVIRIGEGPTAADRHEARVPDLREDHG